MKKVLAAVFVAALMAVNVMAETTASTIGYDYLVVMNKAVTNGTDYSAVSATNGYNLTAYSGWGKLLITTSGDQTVHPVTNSTLLVQAANSHTGTYTTVTSGTLSGLASTGTYQAINYDLTGNKKWLRVSANLLATNECKQTIQVILVAPHKND